MDRNNNFDCVRLIFATFVVISHSYVLTGASEGDFLYRATSGQTMFSHVGVAGFFVVSGYLVFESLCRSTSVVDYLRKRVRRIVPALLVMLLITLMVLPVVYDSSIPYTKNVEVWTYLPRNLLLATQYHITGVFENNPYPRVINGSLWTIRYEVAMYLLLALLFAVRRKRLVIVVFSISVWAFCIVALLCLGTDVLQINAVFRVKNLLQLGACFWGGVACVSLGISTVRRFLPLVLTVVAIIAVLAIVYGFLDKVFYIIMPFAVLSFSLYPLPYIRSLGNKIGDLSYGLYIYAFTVQQMIVFFCRPTSLTLIFATLAITVPLAYASWHLIEKRFVRR